MTNALIKTSQTKHGKVIPQLIMPIFEGQTFIDAADGLPGDVVLCVVAETNRNDADIYQSAWYLLRNVNDALRLGDTENVKELFDYFSNDDVRAAQAPRMLHISVPFRPSDTPDSELKGNVELVRYLLPWVKPDTLQELLESALDREANLFEVPLDAPRNIARDMEIAQSKAPIGMDGLSAVVTTYNDNASSNLEVVKLIAQKATQPIKDDILGKEAKVIDGLLGRLDKDNQEDTLCTTANFLRKIFLLIACGADADAPSECLNDKSLSEHAQLLTIRGFPQLSNIVTAGKQLAAEWGNTPPVYERPYDKIAATLATNAAPKLIELTA